MSAPVALSANGKWVSINNSILTLIAQGQGGGPSGIVPSGLSNISVFTHGQSNAGYFDISDGASLLAAQCLSFWLGGTGTPVSVDGTLSGNSTQAGVGVYCGVSGYASYLNYGGDSVSAAQTASYSNRGTAMITSINTLTTQQKANTLLIILDHGETDSLFAGTGLTGGLNYTDKPVYKAAILNDLAQIRAAFGKTAAQLPVAAFGVTYGTLSGYAMVREAWAELAANSANNIVWAIQQTGDDIVRGDNWNASTGLVTVGSPNSGHVDNRTNLTFAARLALAAARAVAVSNGVPVNDIPASYGAGIGPQIISAKLVGNTVTCVVRHDGGTDLSIPLLAADAVGFTVMDGGSIISPGNLIAGVACTYINNTSFKITLASTPVNPKTNCYLYYPIVGAPTNANQPLQLIGYGCAVTDNFASILAANNLALPNVPGLAWNGNYPVCSPITITGSGASASALFGIALS